MFRFRKRTQQPPPPSVSRLRRSGTYYAGSCRERARSGSFSLLFLSFLLAGHDLIQVCLLSCLPVLYCSFPSSKTFAVELLALSEFYDLALLRLRPSDVKTAAPSAAEGPLTAAAAAPVVFPRAIPLMVDSMYSGKPVAKIACPPDETTGGGGDDSSSVADGTVSDLFLLPGAFRATDFGEADWPSFPNDSGVAGVDHVGLVAVHTGWFTERDSTYPPVADDVQRWAIGLQLSCLIPTEDSEEEGSAIFASSASSSNSSSSAAPDGVPSDGPSSSFFGSGSGSKAPGIFVHSGVLLPVLNKLEVVPRPPTPAAGSRRSGWTVSKRWGSRRKRN